MDRIVVLGAGSFGGSIAEVLAKEHLVTVVDVDSEKLNILRPRVDARFIAGEAQSPSILTKAGCEEADAILAVTASDVVNLSACHICNTLFGESGKATRIARIRNREISEDRNLLDAFGVSQAYNTEDLVSEAVSNVIEFVGARKVHRFFGGDTNIMLIKVRASDASVGKKIGEWQSSDPDLSFRVIALQRGEKITRPLPETRISKDDELLVVSRSNDCIKAINLHKKDSDLLSNKVFIAGGGTIGEAIAARLEDHYNVTLIEPDPARCARLVQNLGSTLVDNGDPTDASMLRSEDIEHALYFCAVTEKDEVNIMSALLAKQLGCEKTAVLVNRNAYQQVLLDHEMDTVISPSEITVGTLLRAIGERRREQIHAMNELGAHLLEFTVMEGSVIEGTNFADVQWPKNVIPCAFGRSGNGSYKGNMPDSDDSLESDDRVIVFVTDRNNNTLNELVDLPFYV